MIRLPDARDTFDVQRKKWKHQKLLEEVDYCFNSRLFWLVCVPLSTGIMLLAGLFVYAVWSWMSVNP